MKRNLTMKFYLIVFLFFCVNHLSAEAPNKHSLLAPFRSGGNDGLNNLILIPQMESAISHGKDAILFEVSTEIIGNNFLDVEGLSFITNDAKAIESHSRLTWGVLEYLDLSIDFSFTDYSGQITALINDESVFFANSTANREITDPVLEARFQVWGGERPGTGLSFRGAVKFPVGDNQDLHSTGAFDFSAGLLGSLDLDWGVWHANFNHTFVGEQKVFRSQANIELTNTTSFGLGYMFEILPNRWAAGIQILGFSNPFRNVRDDLVSFNGIPISVVIGTRWYPYRNVFLELGGGPGLTPDAADYSLFFNLGYQR